jgi:HSP20 family protein
MRALKPWTGMAAFKQEMDRLFDRFTGLKWDEFPTLGELTLGEWAPSLDLSETKENFVVKAEVPGMDAKDIEISLQEDLLTIKGEKKQEKEEKDERHHRVERAYGAFTRSVRLPVSVDGSKVNATFKNGLLTITLPKTPAAKGVAIPIKAE